jgi:hypothetical protein
MFCFARFVACQQLLQVRVIGVDLPSLTKPPNSLFSWLTGIFVLLKLVVLCGRCAVLRCAVQAFGLCRILCGLYASAWPLLWRLHLTGPSHGWERSSTFPRAGKDW